MRHRIGGVVLVALLCASAVQAQEGASQTRQVTPAQLRDAVNKLATIDFPVRMEAARTIRRVRSSLVR